MKQIYSHILLILLLFILLFYVISRSIQEPFQNVDSDFSLLNSVEDLQKANQTINQKTEQCNAYFPNNSFCQFDEDLNQCKCKYQKDSVKYAFPSPISCCDRLCSLLPREKCLASTSLEKPTYYCNIGGVCLPRTATIRDNQISANNCGTDPLNNQLLLPYMTKEECEKTADPCDVYNSKFKTESEKKDACLKDDKCGYCTNQYNVGKCISGTASGPLDLQKYYYCVPSRTQGSYEYQYGDHAQALNISNLKK
jgi:hypothetical protein